MEQLFGARIGPESNNFSGLESGTRKEQLFGARIGARIEQLFVARGSWLWMFLQGLFGGHRFNLHICVHQPSFRGSNGIRLFGARIRDPNGTGIGARIEQLFGARDPNGTAFRGPNRGPNRTTFRGRGSWLWMFLQGLFGGHRFNLHICVHQPSFRGSNGIRLFGARIRDPNGTAFRGPNRGPNRTTFRGPGPEWNSFSGPESGPESNDFSGPGLLAVDVSPGALWRPPFQSAHLCPPAIFSGLGLFAARIRDPNGTAFRGPNRGPARGLLAVDVPPGALWRPPFQSAHLCPPAIFSGPEWKLFGARAQCPNGSFFLVVLEYFVQVGLFCFLGI